MLETDLARGWIAGVDIEQRGIIADEDDRLQLGIFIHPIALVETFTVNDIEKIGSLLGHCRLKLDVCTHKTMQSSNFRHKNVARLNYYTAFYKL